MSLALSDLITPEDRDSVLATLLAVSALLNAPTTSWQEGAPLLTMLTTAAQKLADLSVVAVDITKGGFGELLPSDAWADRWALSRFNVIRDPAVAAAGPLTIVADASAAGHTYAIGEIIVAHATTHQTYRNSAPVTIVPSTTITLQAFAADAPGSAGTAAPGSVTVLVSTIVGLTITNPVSWLGADAETTPAFVTRARSKLGALSPNGPKDVYDYVAKTRFFPDGTPCCLTSVPNTRTRTVVDESTGVIHVYCATAAGAPSGGDIAITQAAIDAFAEPWGDTATAIAGTPVVVNITYQVWVQGTNLTSLQIQTKIATALALWFSTLPFGGYVIPPDTGDVYVEALEQVIASAVPGTLRAVVSVPASAVPLAPNQIGQLGSITPTVTLL